MKLQEYHKKYQQSIEHPEIFWSEVANKISWFKKWDQVKKTSFQKPISIEWFKGGQLNASFNCLDRHVISQPHKIAFYFEPDHPEDDSEKITYLQLFKKVCKMTRLLKAEGIKKGDVVTIYMPMNPDAVVSILACARLGAIHSVVFGGFSAEAMADRIQDGKSECLITSNFGFRGAKSIPLFQTAAEALKKSPSIKKVFLFERSLEKKRKLYPAESLDGQIKISTPLILVNDFLNSDLFLKKTSSPLQISSEQRKLFCCDQILQILKDDPDFIYEPPEICEAEDPLFLLYTSGSTNKPKGVLHTTGGYLVYAHYTFEQVFDYKPNDIYWCTADVGWITGHSYIIYGPLSNGASVVLYEGTPSFPDPSRFWQVIDKYLVSIFYTAPTALRSLMCESTDYVKRTSRKSLRLLGSVGEPINPEAWQWYFNVVGEGKSPIVDTWWQTETGGILITPIPHTTPLKPGSATLPFYGVQPKLLTFEGKLISGPGEGVLVLKDSWPGQMRTVYQDHDRFFQTYFSSYPNYYFTGDGCRRDEDGYYWITGRVDDVLNVSGHRLGTAEIESALVANLKVAEAAVVGFPHDLKGQGIYAYVTLKKGIPESEALKEELIQQVRTEISPIAKPDKIQWAPQLPKTRSGKIMRRILRKIAEGQIEHLGDTSTLADPNVVQQLIKDRL